MKKIIIISLLLVLTGCIAKPRFYNGSYYMTGDSKCRIFRGGTGNTIDCYDSDDKYTGYRNALTQQQLEMYRFKKQQERTTTTNCRRNYLGGMNCTTN